jgi:hypothetical protein
MLFDPVSSVTEAEEDRYLVYLVCLVCLVNQDQLDKQNKPDEPDRPGLPQMCGPLNSHRATIVCPQPPRNPGTHAGLCTLVVDRCVKRRPAADGVRRCRERRTLRRESRNDRGDDNTGGSPLVVGLQAARLYFSLRHFSGNPATGVGFQHMRCPIYIRCAMVVPQASHRYNRNPRRG